MKRCRGVFGIAARAAAATAAATAATIGTIVLQPVTIKCVTVAYLVTLEDMASLDGGRFTGVLDEAITFGSA